MQERRECDIPRNVAPCAGGNKPHHADMTETAGLWLSLTRRGKDGRPVAEYVQVHAHPGPLPPGLGLFRSKHQAKAARWYAQNHPSRPTPPDLIPVAFS